MANYNAWFRSNYFKVKDVKAFEEYCKKYDFEPIVSDENKELRGFLMGDYSEGGVPSNVYNDETEDWDDVDPIAELADHLEDGHVAIVMEVGFEKLKYLVGYATAINSLGDTKRVSLRDIYDEAEILGRFITEATY